MKITKIPASRTGLFVIICFSLLVLGLFLIGDKQKLFSNTSTYYAKYKDVNGLKPGAQVIITGINVGSVNSIDLPKKAGDSVLISMHIVKDAQSLIHTDSKASVVTIGLVGDKTVSVSVGNAGTPVLPVGGFITGQDQRELSGLLDTLSAALNSIKVVTDAASTIARDIQNGKGTLGKFITDESLYNNLNSIARNTDNSISSIGREIAGMRNSVDSALGNISMATGEFGKFGKSLNNSKGSIGRLINDTDMYYRLSHLSESIAATIVELRDAMVKFSTAGGNTAEITEALKHNFLVKSYFEDRGYWKSDAAANTIQNKIDSLQKLQIQVDEKLKQLHRKP